MSIFSSLPFFTCEDEKLERAFRLALGTLTANTRPLKTGILPEPRPCLMAGLDYLSPWTRDAAINVYFAAALLDPDVACNTLLSVLEEGENGPVIGGQYWDKFIWTLGAQRLWHVSHDEDFLRFAYDVILRTARILIDEEFDPADGLFRGPAVYGDGISAYPEKYRTPSLSSGILAWPRECPELRFPKGGGIPMKALSTNCMYMRAFQALSEMAEALHEDAAPWTDRALKLKDAINRAFWNPATGLYDYLAGECDAQEGMGLAFAVLFGAADESQVRSIMEHAYITPQGIACVWPSFPPYNKTGYGRHSGTVWPHIQGFWALAALKAGRWDLFSSELQNLAFHAIRDGQFAEIYHPEDGRIYGGIQEGGGEYLEWHSCVGQTWSASALLAMVLYGLCGLELEDLKGCSRQEDKSVRLTGLPTEKDRVYKLTL